MSSTTVPTPSVATETDAQAFWSVGALMIVKMSGEQTNGEYALVDHTAPAGWESPYHVHHGEDELFHIISGEIECCYGEDGAERLRAGPNDTVFLPRDVPHGFRVVGDEACRMLIHVTPAGFEKFAEEAGRPAPSLTTPPQEEPDVAALMEVAAKYDLEILGPLPE
ncbi:Cupin domain protein [Halogranum rubrum]|uniref:Cupin domain protein n=1 Tax=Halogranum rubrum TaxID=553466 RepID=A0A1I4CA96_9EURY|nr:cupin domain-containing protein [Halogranum rubrum]SFK77865.1 Cupin domain protein [Halogranum rubrum]